MSERAQVVADPHTDIPTVGILRELLRNLQAWEELHRQYGDFDTVSYFDTTTGRSHIYHLRDIQYLYSCRTLLTTRQRQAIELCLYEDQREVDVALLMQVSPTNPVAMYATNGIKKIISLAHAGELPHFRPSREEEAGD